MKSVFKKMDRLTLNIFTAAGLLLLPLCLAIYYMHDTSKFIIGMGIVAFVIVLPETPTLFRDIKKMIGNQE